MEGLGINIFFEGVEEVLVKRVRELMVYDVLFRS